MLIYRKGFGINWSALRRILLFLNVKKGRLCLMNKTVFLNLMRNDEGDC